MWREKGTKSLVDKVSTAVVSTKKNKSKVHHKKERLVSRFRAYENIVPVSDYARDRYRGFSLGGSMRMT